MSVPYDRKWNMELNLVLGENVTVCHQSLFHQLVLGT